MAIREPLEPSGCPKAMAPPSLFTMSGSSPRRRMLARDWVANASLSSTAPRSPTLSPLRLSTFWVAGTGPMPMISGSQPAEAPSMMRARGVRPSRWIADSEATMMADAPSLREDELPAVTTEPPGTTGRRPDRTSMEVPARGPSSVSTTVSALRVLTVTGTISSLKRPAPMAASAFSWERTAKASASSREMPSTRPTSSAVSGMENVILPSRDSSPRLNRGSRSASRWRCRRCPRASRRPSAAFPEPRAHGSWTPRRRPPRYPRPRT
jgi:hypothetical protein